MADMSSYGQLNSVGWIRDLDRFADSEGDEWMRVRDLDRMPGLCSVQKMGEVDEDFGDPTFAKTREHRENPRLLAAIRLSDGGVWGWPEDEVILLCGSMAQKTEHFSEAEPTWFEGIESIRGQIEARSAEVERRLDTRAKMRGWIE